MSEINHLDFEANELSRLYWWTAEYGLVGDIDDYKIYGAGLLSSMFESFSCFDNSVKKVNLCISCTHEHYDITKPQTKLFVSKNFSSLFNLLEEFEKNLAFSVGGIDALEKASKAKVPACVVLDSEIRIEGHLKSYKILEN